ncbi:hypothetical protein [Maricaulis sp. CAU 1757]
MRTLQGMYQGEPPPNATTRNLPIRMLPFALAAALAAYGLAYTVGAGEMMSPLFAAIVGGWTLGRLSRRD